MDRVIDKAMLTQAFDVYEASLAAEYARYESFEPSRKFYKRINKLIKSRTNIYHKLTLTKARRALVVAAIIVTLIAASLSVDAVREKIFSFFITGVGEVDVIEYGGNNGDVNPPAYTSEAAPSYLPEGYTLTDTQTTDESVLLYYENGGDYLTIEKFKKQSYKSAVDAEFKTSTRENYNGTDYIVKTDGEMTMLIWEDDYNVFEAVGFVGTDELLKTAASVK